MENLKDGSEEIGQTKCRYCGCKENTWRKHPLCKETYEKIKELEIRYLIDRKLIRH